jgi:AcrR family transcriptional regulator
VAGHAASDRDRGGRTRADGSRSSDPRDEIIAAATRLFAEKGYADTTMKAVADAVGLRQPSVYYWFRNKEELLHATASINRYSATVVALLTANDSAPPPAKLYRLLYEDTRHICLLRPLDYHQVESIAYQRPQEFSQFWADYRALFDGVVAFIEDSQKLKNFRSSDSLSAAAAALGLNEGLQKLRRHHAGSVAAVDFPIPVPALDDVSAVAHLSATTTLLSHLVDHTSLDTVRAEAMAIELPPDSQ